MGSLKDELNKLFPEAGERIEKAKAEAKNRRIERSDNDWKNGVRPFNNSRDRYAPPVQPARRKAVYDAAGKPPTLGNRPSQKKTSLIQEVAEFNVSLSSVYGQKKKDNCRPCSPQNKSSNPEVKLGAIPQASIARTEEFKIPDSWVKEGIYLQPPNALGGPVLTVRIGIDFGTAYTKMAISAAQKVFLIDWDGVRLSSQRYLLPGELSVESDTSTWLGRKSADANVINNLKLPFLSGQDPGLEASAKAVVFLAWLMRYARAWLYHTQPSLVKNRRLAWEVNIGIPTDSYASDPLKPIYSRIGCCGWQLSQTQGEPALAIASSMLKAESPDLQAIGLNDINLMPEFVAQIAGYVNSPQRQNGLHLLVDVGAGTLDIASFNVHRETLESENRFPVFASAVKYLGTHYLMAYRIRELGLKNTQWDDLSGTPTADEIARNLSLGIDDIRKVDVDFSKEISKSIAAVLQYTKQERYPLAPEWRAGLRVFLAGGGSGSAVYQAGLQQSFSNMKVPFRYFNMPIPDDVLFCKFDSSHFHRMSVAYGLTFDAESIGRIIRPHEIENLGIKNSISYCGLDRDDLYQK
jgi:hypothetical protein